MCLILFVRPTLVLVLASFSNLRLASSSSTCGAAENEHACVSGSVPAASLLQSRTSEAVVGSNLQATVRRVFTRYEKKIGKDPGPLSKFSSACNFAVMVIEANFNKDKSIDKAELPATIVSSCKEIKSLRPKCDEMGEFLKQTPPNKAAFCQKMHAVMLELKETPKPAALTDKHADRINTENSNTHGGRFSWLWNSVNKLLGL